MGVLSNKVEKEILTAGDHIYSWRAAWAYAHHGIYVGDDTVIHFTAGRDQEVATGTFIDLLVSSSVPRSRTPCLVCSSNHVTADGATETNGVRSSCLSCFLAGGDLYRFEYAVSRAIYHSRVRGGTCSLATANPDEEVVRRAYYSLSSGFGSYNLVKNNCEHFATYCKTASVQPSGQVVSTIVTTTTVLFGLVIGLIALPLYLVASHVRDSMEEEAEEEK